jgi:hypothetical protein
LQDFYFVDDFETIHFDSSQVKKIYRCNFGFEVVCIVPKTKDLEPIFYVVDTHTQAMMFTSTGKERDQSSWYTKFTFGDLKINYYKSVRHCMPEPRRIWPSFRGVNGVCFDGYRQNDDYVFYKALMMSRRSTHRIEDKDSEVPAPRPLFQTAEVKCEEIINNQ